MHSVFIILSCYTELDNLLLKLYFSTYKANNGNEIQ